ncbi:hypothetical protein AVEN_193822-1 [Araneus ventricosus]|uniref:Uncharacterized protein n=1 Tax=Araneus ventricosus TaxID=182803 RepID=A0A4Y2XA35_ARAVE|nr:hypothetical protein AVEN_193822-1 [Araneus ventricosus]
MDLLASEVWDINLCCVDFMECMSLKYKQKLGVTILHVASNLQSSVVHLALWNIFCFGALKFDDIAVVLV